MVALGSNALAAYSPTTAPRAAAPQALAFDCVALPALVGFVAAPMPQASRAWAKYCAKGVICWMAAAMPMAFAPCAALVLTNALTMLCPNASATLVPVRALVIMAVLALLMILALSCVPKVLDAETLAICRLVGKYA